MEMAAQKGISRPVTLIQRQIYLRGEIHPAGQALRWTAVTFLDYDACPAWVFIRDTNGERLRCPREEIYCMDWARV